jgi:lysophospholipase L1-like esterase
MKTLALVCALLLTPAAFPQDTAPPSPLMSGTDTLALGHRIVELMEATTLVLPGMLQAGGPAGENVRQSLTTMEATSAQNASLLFTFLTNTRAYLALADVMPKPYPFPEQARRQMEELRNGVDRLDSHFRALLDQKELQLRNPDRDNLKRYAEANAKLAPPVAEVPRVVFLGDSITDAWRLNEYFPGRDFVNRGISGQITGEMLGRMKADVIDLKPRAMLVLAGTNDIARGVAIATIENNLALIATLAEANQIKPLFASILPISDYHKDVNPRFEMSKSRPPALILELNRWLRQFCTQRGYPYVDYFSAMVDQAGFLKPDLADDGLHPNSAGYRVMGPVAQAAIDAVAAAKPPKVAKKRLGIF